MGKTILLGVLKMPPELWTGDPLDVSQRHSRYLEAASLIEKHTEKKCKWVRAFDSHFNIGCVNQTGKRANGSFKKVEPDEITQWDFVYCPHCGGKIETIKQHKNQD